jgi:hypothetical protein
MKRPPIPSKSEERVSPLPPLPPPNTPADKLIQLLIRKGVLSEEEGRKLYPQ